MKARSSPVRPRRESLSSTVVAVGVAGVVVVCLAVFFPRQLRERTIEDPNRGAVTRSIQRVLLRTHPDDVELRLSLAEAEAEAGEHEEAAAVLGAVQAGADPRLRRAAFSVTVTRWRAASDGTLLRAQLRSELVEKLALGMDGETVELGERATAAVELGRPDLAVDPLRRIALRNDPELPPSFEVECRSAGLAASGGACAALLALKRALSSEVEGAEAQLLRELVGYARYDVVLQTADVLAHGRSAIALIVPWWEARVAGTSPEPAALGHLRKDLLAIGATRRAFELARRRSTLDAGEAMETARLAEWSGQVREAAQLWARLGLAGDAAALERAIELTMQLGDGRALERLLVAKSRRGGISPQERSAFIAVVVANDPPEVAAASMRSFAAGAGWTRELAVEVARSLERGGRLAEASSAWAYVAREYGASAEGVEAQATLLWRVGKRAEALDVLARARAAGLDAGASHWRLAAEIAWQAEAHVVAREAYQKLRELHDLRPGEGDRLVALARRGSASDAVALGAALWREGDDRFLLVALGLALEERMWVKVRALLDEARRRDRVPEEATAYWLIEGELAMHDRDWHAALASFDRVWALAPDPDLRRRRVWVALQADDRAALAALLGTWPPGDASDAALRARVLDRLDRSPEARRLLAQASAANPDDLELLVAHAASLEHSGDESAGRAARRRALARLQVLAREGHLGSSNAMLHVSLLSEFAGAAPAYASLRRMLAEPHDRDQTRFAFSWLLAHDLASEARTVVEGEREAFGDESLLALALAEGDRPAALELVQSSTSLTSAERARALHALGDAEGARRQYALALQSASGTDAAAVSRDMAWLPPAGLRVSTTFDLASGPTNRLETWHAAAEQTVPFGRLLVDAAVGRMVGAPAIGASPTGALMVIAERASAERTTQGAVGVDWRSESVVPSAVLRHRETLGRSVTVAGEAVWHDTASLPPNLRPTTVRDAALAQASVRVSPSTVVRASGGGLRYASRAGDTLGAGVTTDAAVEQALPVRFPSVLWRITGSGTALSSDPADPVAGHPLRFGMVGTGITVTTGSLDDERRRLRFQADAWAGWMLPADRPATQLRLGFAARLLPQTELVVDGYRVTDQWWGSQATEGLQVGLRRRFEP